MKKIILLAVFLIAGFGFNNETDARTNYYGNGYFYSALEPHGVWIEINGGVLAWRPTIMRKTWSPYRDGRWIWTEYGWYWDSYEPFGYIAYHYGRWFYDDYYGWIWLPDDVWAPAWVEWRYDDYYVGWAPLSPYGQFSISIGIHFTYNYHPPYYHWNYVNINHFCDPYVYKYMVGSKHKYRIYKRTKYRTNYGVSDGRVVNRGVSRDHIRNRTGQRVEERTIRNVTSPGDIGRNRNRDDKYVNTYIPNERELNRELRSDAKITRSDRKVNLETSKLAVGNRRNTSRDEQPNIYPKKPERNAPNENKDRNDINKKRIETEREKIIRENTERTKRSNETVSPRNNNEVKKPVERKTPAVAPKRETERINTTPERVIENKRTNTSTSRKTETYTPRNTERRAKVNTDSRTSTRVERSVPVQQERVEKKSTERSNSNDSNRETNGRGRR